MSHTGYTTAFAWNRTQAFWYDSRCPTTGPLLHYFRMLGTRRATYDFPPLETHRAVVTQMDEGRLGQLERGAEGSTGGSGQDGSGGQSDTAHGFEEDGWEEKEVIQPFLTLSLSPERGAFFPTTDRRGSNGGTAARKPSSNGFSPG